VGCNSRLDAIQAAILDIKLQYLDQYNEARIALAAKYNQAFANHAKVKTPFVAHYGKHVYHQYTLTLLPEIDSAAFRDEMKQFLADNSIPSMIYYPVASHHQKMFDAFGGSGYHLETTDWLNKRVISLPMHTEMSEEQSDYIIKKVLEFLN
jgi:dTDP-4-amino-4,6-dideoxygalactose transaminase